MLFSAAKPALDVAVETAGTVAEKVGKTYSAFDRARLSLMSADKRAAVIRERHRSSLLASIAEAERAARDQRFLWCWIPLGPLIFGLSIWGCQEPNAFLSPETAVFGCVFSLLGAPIAAYLLAAMSVKKVPPRPVQRLYDRLNRL
jgi:hypothetical protein